MKKLLIALAVATVGCSGQSLVGPTATSTNTSSSAAASGAAGNAGGGAGSTHDGAGSVSGTPTNGQAARPEYSVQGPLGCLPAGTDPMQWLVNMTDAGPSQLRFVALAHNALEPGCAATVDNPRSRVSVAGVTDYPPHTQGQTIFGFDPRSFSCGRVQVDVSAFDTQGRETLLIGMVVNYGTVCQAPPPPVPPIPPIPPVVTALQCAPGRQTVAPNQSINLTATGGNGVYEWSAGGAPAGSGRATLAMSFPSVGEHAVTVASAGLTATCVVVVEATPPPPPPVPQLVCLPAASTVLTGQPVPLQATGGTGDYAWAVSAGTPSNGTGATFSTQFAAAGTHTVTVTSGQLTAVCTVTVTAPPPPPPPPPVPTLACTPATSAVLTNQPVALQATGGTGTYTWSTASGTPTAGSGAAFSTAFATAGTHTVSVTSGQATATCAVTVTPPPVTPLFCAPDYITTTAGQPVTVQASGGNGSYSWFVFGGSPDAGTGASFTTTFSVAGSYRIYVRSANLEGKCRVEVAVDDDDRPALTRRTTTSGQ